MDMEIHIQSCLSYPAVTKHDRICANGRLFAQSIGAYPQNTHPSTAVEVFSAHHRLDEKV